jgi:hypothetical protein
VTSTRASVRGHLIHIAAHFDRFGLDKAVEYAAESGLYPEGFLHLAGRFEPKARSGRLEEGGC